MTETAATTPEKTAPGTGSSGVPVVIDLEIGKRVTVQDVANATPLETQEETKVLKSLDEEVNNNTNDSNHNHGKTLSQGILEGVPDEQSHIFQQPQQSSRGENSMERELHGLVREMTQRSLFPEKQRHSKVKDCFEKIGADADKLFQKARILHYHNNNNNKGAREEARETFAEFRAFVDYQRTSKWAYWMRSILLMVLLTGVSVVLFYFCGNPYFSNISLNPEGRATISWWCLFVVRHICTWGLAKISQALVIDFFCLRRPILLKILGPYITLLLVQSKGWPCHVVFFSFYDLVMLQGNYDFARQWLYYQPWIHLFTDKNDAGTITNNVLYRNVLIYLFVLGCAVSLKRIVMGLSYGQGIYQRYGQDLTVVMKKSLLLQKLAKHVHAAEQVRRKTTTPEQQQAGLNDDSKRDTEIHLNYTELVENRSTKTDEDAKTDDDDSQIEEEEPHELLIKTHRRNHFSGGLAASEQIKIRTLLGEWEEPENHDKKMQAASLGALVQFRTGISCLDQQYPFSRLFGLANKRENCKTLLLVP